MTSPHDILSKYLSPGLVLLNRYQLEQPVGGGAYGMIYAALDLSSHERVAIKALPPPQENNSKTAQGRFLREMKVISKLTHPHIVHIYDVGETPDQIPFMVLEFVQGQTLEREVQGRPMPVELGLETTRQIALALGAAHELGVIHRDLKPANIMVERRPGHVNVKVLDFGMAKVLSPLDDESLVQLTREGVAVGTPRYIAPEQARGQQVGPWTDLYALGLLMYEIFTGERAVKASTIDAAVVAHVSPEPLPLPELHLIPPSLHPILTKLLQKDARKRYQLAAEVVRDLDQVAHALRQPRHSPASSAQAPSVGASAVPFARQELTLELDYDRVEAAEQARRDSHDAMPPLAQAPASHRTPGRNLLEEPPKSKLIWIEAALALPALAWGYQLWTAQFFHDDPYLVRVTLSAIPFIATLILSFVLISRVRWLNMPRLLMLCSLVIIASAHVRPRVLMTQLIREPAWFLAPMKDAPIFKALYELAVFVGREYALILGSLLR